MDRQENPKEPKQPGGGDGYAVDSGEYATLVKSYKGFNIFFVGDRYYALTADYGELLPNEVVQKQHSLVSESLLELEDEVDTAIAFSNSRGHFDNRFRQKVKGAFMKAESVHDNKLDDGVSAGLPSGKVIYIKELDEYFFVTPDEVSSGGFEDIGSSFVNAYYASSQAELIATIGNYNLVSFDSKIFAVQQGRPVADIEWRTGLVSKRPDVHTFSNTKDAIRYVKSQLVTDNGSAPQVSPSSAPQLVETDAHRQINYVFYRGLYYAIPHSLGSINLQDISSQIPDGVVFSDSFDSLKQFSSKGGSISGTPSGLESSGESDVPRLLKSEAGYNVVAFGGYYFAIPHSLGAINLLETDVMSMPEIVRDVSLYVIEEYIAEQRRLNSPTSKSSETLPSQSSQDTPRLLKSQVGYNVVAFGGYYFAIPQSLGAINLLETDVMSMPEIVRDVSLHVIEEYIAEQRRLNSPTSKSSETLPSQSSQDTPRLLKSEAGYNVVAFGGYYFAIPHSLGAINLLETDLISMPEIVRDISLHVIEEYIAEQRRFKKQDTIAQQQAQLQQAQEVIAAMKTSKFWKLRDLWFRFKKLIRLPIDECDLQVAPNQPINIQLQQAQDIIAAMKTSKFWKLRTAWFRLKRVLGLRGE